MNTAEQMKKLSRFTRRAHTPDEVYLFDVILCDNEIDRDGERFSLSALEELKSLFVGVTGIFDHVPKSSGQTARIYDTELCEDATRKTSTGEVYTCLKGHAYMVRTEKNADLIREIDGGIKKEVSISCTAEEQLCSVCGANHRKAPCAHLKGKQYGSKRCHYILGGITDAYEWSFVAVPAQPRAGVTKHCSAQNGTSAEVESLRRAVKEREQILDAVRADVKKDVSRLLSVSGTGAYRSILEKAADEMSLTELIAFRKILQRNAAPSCSTQLGTLQESEQTVAPFRF
ncbi:MAG: hypothetical protein IJY85_02185 [Ruminococcus sp.]|nr:hypothetical protein [Ruminococcus sp.]